MVHATYQRPRSARADLADGSILFDPDRIAQASPSLLDPDSYGSDGSGPRGGRGAVWFVRGSFGSGVLRHYRRGGLAARISRDKYLFRGAERTRPFREFRLMQALHGQGLPVPRPLAAGYRRDGSFYRADILSERIADAQTLAERLRAGPLPEASWRQLGATLARFHAVGAFHADLNAHNLMLVAPGDAVWVIDFDRGALRVPGRWSVRNLERLQRSLRKLAAQRGEGFDSAGWALLMAGYRDAGGRT